MDTHNATSSPESADGHLPYVSPDGLTLNLFGPAPAPASRSVSPEKDLATPTNGTSGPPSAISLRSAALTASLASRLQARLEKVGSMEYRQTWKKMATPAGVPYWAHTASAHRTKDSDCFGWLTPQATQGPNMSENRGEDYGGRRARVTPQSVEAILVGWPTASARDYKDTPGMAETGTNPDGSTRSRMDQLPRVAQMVAWPSRNAHDGRRPGCDMKSTQGGNLSRDAHLVGWATPRSTDAKCGGHCTENMTGKDLAKDANIAGWVSPTATDGQRGTNPPRPHDTGTPLSQQVAGIAGWATPDAAAMNDGERLETWDARQLCNKAKHKNGNGAGMPLAIQSLTISGSTPDSSNVETESYAGYQLNPHFSLWLMGYPTSWHDAGAFALRSLRAQATR